MVSVHRTGQPIRRNSKERGACEARFYQSFDRRDVGLYLRSAERYDRAQRKKGEPQGPLGPIGLEVLRELLRIIDFRSGRLEPAIGTLMTRLRRSKDAVVGALARLKAHGFLEWLRRWEPVEDPQPFGPQVKQATNAYRLLWPAIARRLLGHAAVQTPACEGLEQEAHDRAQEVEAMIASLDIEGQVDARLGDSDLAAAIKRLKRAQRESAERSEPDTIQESNR